MSHAGATIIASPEVTDEACFSVPAVRALHYANPGTPIYVTAPEDIAPLWETVSEVTGVIPHNGSARKIAKELRDFSESLAWAPGPAAIAFSKAGIPKRIGPSTAKLEKFLTDPIVIEQKVGPVIHRVRHYLAFVEKMGAAAFEGVNFQSPPRPPAPSQTRIAIAPGSDFGPASEWDPARFCELTQRLLVNEIYLLPSPDHPGPAKALGEALGNDVTLFDGSPSETLDLLATCHLFIGNDGALPHLAAHMGTPSLVLFGPNEPEWKRPLGKAHVIIRKVVACSGCFLEKCQTDHRCMTEISVDEVLEIVPKILSSPSL
mgnify:FL=1|jgi:heptosyltransferase-2|tara:strand:- start:122 stop:1075 length:954 start_codon:yes stop_codon:yes gene_type:complete